MNLWHLAARATRMAGEAHRRGDYLACARLQATSRRYRDAALATRQRITTREG